MAPKKFLIEVEEGETECCDCPYGKNIITGCISCNAGSIIHEKIYCDYYNLATMKIIEMEEEK